METVRIDGNSPAYLVNIKGTQAPQAATATSAAAASGRVASASSGSSGDRVVFSTKNQEIERLKSALNGIPEVRPEKVALAKQKLAAGSYRVDSGSLAQSVVNTLKR